MKPLLILACASASVITVGVAFTVPTTDDAARDRAGSAQRSPASRSRAFPQEDRSDSSSEIHVGSDFAAVSGRDVVAASTVDGEDERSALWDNLTREQRIDASRRDLSEALASMRRGDGGAGARAKADSALTVLRAELHATRQGRIEHRRLELEVEALVDAERARRRAFEVDAAADHDGGRR